MYIVRHIQYSRWDLSSKMKVLMSTCVNQCLINTVMSEAFLSKHLFTLGTVLYCQWKPLFLHCVFTMR